VIAQREAMSIDFTKPLTHRTVLTVAVPIMLANVSEPLIGVVNTAVIGRLNDPAMIGGVAIGGVIFAFLFWGFGFLRLSTSGLAAQATGAGDHPELAAVFWRSLMLAAVIGLAILLLSPLIGPLAVSLMGGSDAVQAANLEYFSWRVLSAPAALANFAILGWFVGQSRTKTALIVQLTLNLINMALSMFFVLNLGWAVAGVGLAAVCAEYAGLILGLLIVANRMRGLGLWFDAAHVFSVAKIRHIISANADIMLRTVLLLFAFGWMASRSARLGDVPVAANAILLHFFDVAAFLTDGFAYTAEAFVGQSIGARNLARYRQAIRLSTFWGMGFGILTGLIIWFAGEPLVRLMTNNESVIAFALHYLGWAALTPALGAACFLYDGIFTGALATREMRNMMVFSTLAYLGAWWLLEPAFGNHGLWAALCVFFVARGLSFASRLPAIEKRVFAAYEKAAVKI
jgi:MATE family multidrug resistance protein